VAGLAGQAGQLMKVVQNGLGSTVSADSLPQGDTKAEPA
jgi:hypothetical protein